MLLTIFIGILGLDIVVLVHELGHLFAAKLMGISVETFSIGMGKEGLEYLAHHQHLPDPGFPVHLEAPESLLW